MTDLWREFAGQGTGICDAVSGQREANHRKAPMKQTKSPRSRRAFIKTSTFGLGALTTGASALASVTSHLSNSVGTLLDTNAKPPASDIAVWVTNGKQRFAAGRPIPWQPASTTPSPDSVGLFQANKFHDL